MGVLPRLKRSRRRDSRLFHTQRARACDFEYDYLTVDGFLLVLVCVTTYDQLKHDHYRSVIYAEVEGSSGSLMRILNFDILLSRLVYRGDPTQSGSVVI